MLLIGDFFTLQQQLDRGLLVGRCILGAAGGVELLHPFLALALARPLQAWFGGLWFIRRAFRLALLCAGFLFGLVIGGFRFDFAFRFVGQCFGAVGQHD